MAKKVCTQKDAVRCAYYIKDGKFDDVDVVRNVDEWEGKWHNTKYDLFHEAWSVSATRTKHQDGRIRGAYSSVDNPLAFALWYIEAQPNSADAAAFAERLSDPANFLFSIEDADLKKAVKARLKDVVMIDVATAKGLLA